MKSFKTAVPVIPIATLALVLPLLFVTASPSFSADRPAAPVQAAPAQAAPAQRPQGQAQPQAQQARPQGQVQAQPQAQAAPAQAGQAPAQAAPAQNGQQKVEPNGITQAAIKAGIKRCAGRMNQVTNFALQGATNSGAILFVPPQGQDAHYASASIELGSTAIPAAYASASFAPAEKGCDGMYEIVIYWPAACGEVAQKQFTGMSQVGTLSKNIPILGGKGNARVFLMTAGTGCVSIKKEVIW